MYKETLDNDLEIMQYIDSLSDPSEETFASYYKDYKAAMDQLSAMFPDQEIIPGHKAKLEEVPIEDLKEGDPEYNRRNFSKERAYLEMDPSTMPPILVNANLEIEDGNHRYRVAKKLGLQYVKCYVIQNETEY